MSRFFLHLQILPNKTSRFIFRNLGMDHFHFKFLGLGKMPDIRMLLGQGTLIITGDITVGAGGGGCMRAGITEKRADVVLKMTKKIILPPQSNFPPMTKKLLATCLIHRIHVSLLYDI
jgi:hypothetical protein